MELRWGRPPHAISITPPTHEPRLRITHPLVEPHRLWASGRGHAGAARGETQAVEIGRSIRTGGLCKGLRRPGTFTPSIQALEVFRLASLPLSVGHFRGT